MPINKSPAVLSQEPSAPAHATTKLYVDTRAVPPGGTEGYVLTKDSGADYAFSWKPGGVGGGGGGISAIRAAPDYDDSVAPTGGQAILWTAGLSKFKPTTLTPALIGADPAGTAAAARTAHEAATDPHPQYLTQAEGDARYSLLGHTHSGADITSGTVSYDRLPVGTGLNTIAAGDDARLTNARTPTAHTHAIADVTGLQATLDGKDAAGAAADAVTAHEAASDPHPQYLTATEGNAAYAALSHTHNASAINAGTLAYARLPVGTTASTVAAGDDARLSDARTPTAHVHSGSDITSGTIAFARLPVGTAANQVAVGNHTHDGLGAGGGGFAAGYIPTGSTQPVVQHGLGTADLIIAVREVSTNLLVHVPVEMVDDTGTASLNWIRFSFTTAPTLNQYRYTVLSAAATLGTGAHTHPESDVTNLAADLAGKAAISHTHVIADTTALQTTLDGKAAATHNHDTAYLSPAQGDAAYAAIGHTHTLAALGAAAAVHTHAAGDLVSGTLALARIPTGTTAATVALGNHTHGAAAPAAHASTHASAGSDPVTPAAIGAAATTHVHAAADITSGTLAIARIPTGTTSTTVPLGNDSRFSDARTPTAHAASHATGGGDVLTPAAIGALDQTAGDTRYRQHNQAVRSASVTTTYALDGTLAGDVELTCTGDTTITPSGTPAGRTVVITCLASGGARTPTLAAAVSLTGGITARSLVIPSGGIGRFVIRYTALGTVGWSLDSAYLVG